VTAVELPSLAPGTTPEGGEVEAEGSAVRMLLRTFAENRLALIGTMTFLALVIFSWVGPLVYHSDQTIPLLRQANSPPAAGQPLGTDSNGYDILGRLMFGGQISIEIGLAVGVASTVVGVLYGALSGFFGKWLDAVMMRLVDVGWAIPPVFLFIFMSEIFSPNKTLLIIILALVSWLVPARLVRGETLSLKTREYVQTMRTMGGGSIRAIYRHIVPNVIGTIVVTITFQIADSILILSTLQYLGFGLPPKQPTWGSMIQDAVSSGAVFSGYWWELWPAAGAIVLAVVAINFVGDALRDAFEVRLQKR
jgi:peptide/nickel transport system permease protein